MCPRGRPRGQGRPRGLHLWRFPYVQKTYEKRILCKPTFSAAPRTIIFYIFFTIIAGDFLFMNNNG